MLETTNQAIKRFRNETPEAGAYFNEGDYFEPDFQESFWGRENYNRLLKIKQQLDPNGLFYCHNCVGSEEWQEGGMCRKGTPTAPAPLPTTITSNAMLNL